MKQVTVAAPQSQRDRNAVRSDPAWSALQIATPTQIDAWLANNVKTVADARRVLRILIIAARNVLSDGGV